MPDIVSIISALGASAWEYLVGHPWAWVKDHPWLCAGAGMLLPFGKKLRDKLEPKLVDWVAESVAHRTAGFLAGYGKLYRKHMYYKHRTFDVKGLSTQGKFALELRNVYIDLEVEPMVIRQDAEHPLRVVEEGSASGDRSIFSWLQADPGHQRNFVIVGPPGSGKTTLLRHLTLMLAANEGPIRRTPILLYVRDHAAAIGANPELKLTEVIDASLRDLPPPPRWFADRISKGKCLIMFDGLDEVADGALRRKVANWIERQLEFPAANRFLVSSRPNGYRKNPLSGFTVLEVLPFDARQVERFIHRWYRANEIMAHQKDDSGVRSESNKGARDLLLRLKGSSTLQELAVNPLALTLIATIHRYRGQLPGLRVELFSEICNVFLGNRQQAKGLEMDLAPAQKVRVLRVLAYEMMSREVQELKSADATKVIAPALKLVMANGDPSTFLQMIEDSSALLVQRESEFFSFAHLTFQEYLASLHIKEENLQHELVRQLDKSWWHETVRLYAAQGDASEIVEACLQRADFSVEALLLAADCEGAALELRPELRIEVHRITREALEDSSAELRRSAAWYLLEQRLRTMLRINDDRQFDRSPVTNAEYQLFIDDMRLRGSLRQPDQWDSNEFEPGTAQNPVFGLRRSDAEEFCGWLNARKPGQWRYALPSQRDLAFREDVEEFRGLDCFVDGQLEEFPVLDPDAIIEQIETDRGVDKPRAVQRGVWLLIYLRSFNHDFGLDADGARGQARQFRDDLFLDLVGAMATNVFLHTERAKSRLADAKERLARARSRARRRSRLGAGLIARRIFFAPVRAHKRITDFAKDIGLFIVSSVANSVQRRVWRHDIKRSGGDSRTAGASGLDRALALEFDRALALDRSLSQDFDRVLALADSIARTHAFNRVRLANILNAFCVIEQRAQKRLQMHQVLWLSRQRFDPNDRLGEAVAGATYPS